MEKRPAYFTYDKSAHAYYFAPTNAAPPPYYRQITTEAIIDVAADGTLAGVELCWGDYPGPPLPASPEKTGE